MKARSGSLVVGSLLLVACASSNGAATVDGTVGGTTLSPSSAFVVGSSIVIGSSGDVCADFSANALRANSQTLVIDAGAIVAGALPVQQATFQVFDAACNASVSTTTTTGSVTFTTVDTSGALNINGAVHGASGTYDITFGGDHITGSFTAVDCSASFAPTTGAACNGV